MVRCLPLVPILPEYDGSTQWGDIYRVIWIHNLCWTKWVELMGSGWEDIGIIGWGPLDPISRGQEKILIFSHCRTILLDWIGIQEPRGKQSFTGFIYFMFVGVDAWIVLFCGLWFAVMLCLVYAFFSSCLSLVMLLCGNSEDGHGSFGSCQFIPPSGNPAWDGIATNYLDHLYGLLYADDVVLCAKSYKQLQKAADHVTTWCTNWKMSIGASKCAVMKI